MHNNSTDHKLPDPEGRKLPRIAILLLNWNSYNYTHTCLQSLKQCPQDLFQVIVIDNLSSDGSVDALEKENPEVIFLRNQENLGFTGGNNVGIEYALKKGYEFIMLLNNDTEVQPNFLEPLLKVLDERPEVGAVQPKMYYNHDRTILWNAGGIIQSWTGRSITIGEGSKDRPEFNVAKEIDWITACCILVRSEIVNRVGGQNEIFFYGSFDDVDWSHRITENGKNKLFYEPAAVLYHDAGVAGKDATPSKEGNLKPFVHYLTQRNNIFYLRLHSKKQYLPTIIAFHFLRCLATLSYFVVRRRFKKLKAAAQGMRDGLRLDLSEKINHVETIKKLNK